MIEAIEKKQEKPRMYPNGYNTLRKRKLLKALDKTSSLREAGIKAGYSSISRNIYKRNTKEYIEKNLKVDKDEILRRFNVAYELSLSEKDITNLLRSNEAFARINGMFLDRTKEEGNTPKIISINYGNTRLSPAIPQAEIPKKLDKPNNELPPI